MERTRRKGLKRARARKNGRSRRRCTRARHVLHALGLALVARDEADLLVPDVAVAHAVLAVAVRALLPVAALALLLGAVARGRRAGRAPRLRRGVGGRRRRRREGRRDREHRRGVGGDVRRWCGLEAEGRRRRGQPDGLGHGGGRRRLDQAHLDGRRARVSTRSVSAAPHHSDGIVIRSASSREEDRVGKGEAARRRRRRCWLFRLCGRAAADLSPWMLCLNDEGAGASRALAWSAQFPLKIPRALEAMQPTTA